jgi:ribonuclease HI
MTASREIGIQCELLVDHIPIIKPLTSCIATQTEYMLLELHTPALATVGGNDIAQSDQEVIYIDAPSLKESTSLPECHSPSTFAETTVLLEKVSPQKSICSEYTCTLTDTDTDHDELYMPSAESQTETENESDVEIEKSPVEQKKFVVFEKNLDELFVTCSTCAKPIVEQSKKCIGSMVVVQAVCVDGHQNKWRSQPMIGEKIAGNLLLAGSILFSGNTFQNVNSLAQCLNLAFIGRSTFYDMQKEVLFPVVDKAWKDHQVDLLNETKESSKLDICGDGRCDSPGHCAKYGTYTVMEENSSKILDFEVVQVTEVSSSNAMEAEGCNRVLKNLKTKGVKVRCLTTDRHTTVTAEMRKKHSEITHQYDVWHLSKWVVKKLTKKSKKKEFKDLTDWIQSVSAHFWWSVATCDGNYELLIEKWTSVVNHISNKHSWRHAKHFKKCAHHKLTRREKKEKPWLKPGTAALVALEEIVFNKKLLKDLKLVTEFHHTGNLEVYHSMMLKYCPKRQHFNHEGMVARTQLAALDNNHNCSRKQAVVKKGSNVGSLRYNLVFPKMRKTWVVKPIKEAKQFDYITTLMENILRYKKSKKPKKSKKAKKSAKQAKNIVTKEKPDKETAIKAHISRFPSN